MGKTTDIAVKELFLEREIKTEALLTSGRNLPDVHAAIIVKEFDEDPKKFFLKTATYKDHKHVEHQLMDELHNRYGTFENIPTFATIIFVCTLSPCMNCIKETIPEFLKVLKLKERALRVKFKFGGFYSKENTLISINFEQGGKHRYETNSAAREAYATLCKDYGEYDSKNMLSEDKTELIASKTRMKLSIVHGYQAKCSVVTLGSDIENQEEMQ